MPLIPCLTGTRAVYETATDTEITVVSVPVEAWDDLGAPRVAGTDGLVPAATLQVGFVRLEPLAERATRDARPPREPTPAGTIRVGPAANEPDRR